MNLMGCNLLLLVPSLKIRMFLWVFHKIKILLRSWAISSFRDCDEMICLLNIFHCQGGLVALVKSDLIDLKSYKSAITLSLSIFVKKCKRYLTSQRYSLALFLSPSCQKLFLQHQESEKSPQTKKTKIAKPNFLPSEL